MSSKFLNISTDNTLGGGSASDEIVSSQKAIKEYVDSHSSNVTTDGVTINTNADDELQAIGVIEKNAGNVKYDWVGTSAEYTAQDVATNHPTWVCFITDDETPVNFANTNLSNLTATGKSTCAEYAMPSNTYIDETYTSSYTAPANGYLYISASATGNGGIVALNNTSASFGVQSSGAHSVGYGVYCTIPCKAGDIISVYVAGANVNTFRFIYAEGEV